VALYDGVRELVFEVEDFGTQRREAAVSSEFTRVTTTVVLHGRGAIGEGEDVTYQAEAHDDFPALRERGRFTLDELSQRLDAYALEDYRRWAFESAALDLALRQNGLTLGEALGLDYRPVRFVVSTRLEIRPWLELYPRMEFKLDPTSEWSDDHMGEIAATGAVRVLDLKGQYHGTPVDQAPDPQLYRAVVDTFPDAIIEDPALTDETSEALRGAEARISWDAPIHSADDIAVRDPRYCNIKPSRFGTVQRLFDALDHCRAKAIATYGGGQFELGPGRAHIQRLASLFYADAPNDVAPSDYNVGGPRAELPESPLSVAVERGL
jgi:hypothetical protein